MVRDIGGGEVTETRWRPPTKAEVRALFGARRSRSWKGMGICKPGGRHQLELENISLAWGIRLPRLMSQRTPKRSKNPTIARSMTPYFDRPYCRSLSTTSR